MANNANFYLKFLLQAFYQIYVYLSVFNLFRFAIFCFQQSQQGYKKNESRTLKKKTEKKFLHFIMISSWVGFQLPNSDISSKTFFLCTILNSFPSYRFKSTLQRHSGHLAFFVFFCGLKWQFMAFFATSFFITIL